MNASLSWLKAYVPDLDVTAQEYADALTLSGTMVEGYEELDADLDKIVIGQIVKIDRHPDADKLVICQVKISDDTTVQIVTGAPNVKEGQKVPVVLDGGKVVGGHDGKKVPGGIKIKKGKLRGVESNGMLCSIEELGSTKEMYPKAPDNGIYIFDDDVTVGESAIIELGLDDVIFEHEITSNRVDCYSVIGLAREAAATFNKKFVLPPIKTTGNSEDVNDFIKVTTVDKDLCRRYCARVVKNIKIEPSPEWMQRRLASQGIRPINNIVDITNYVMAEYGQPMHAYDMDTIAGHEIIVRRAQKDEKFITLDGQERNLDETILMICDADKPVGIAGIMGGENSMITNDVKTMLFEAACFDGTNIRLSSKKIGLRTDASSKFEKGLDPNTALEAINRACELVEELGAGEVVGGTIDVYNDVREGNRVTFEPDRVNKMLGTNISKEDMIEYLARVELTYDENTNEIVVPSWRQDVVATCDITEEVARFFGYNNIPTTLPTGEATIGGISFKAKVEKIARNVAEYFGFSQSMTYSFESPKVFGKLLVPEESDLRKVIKISNPLGEDFSIMRTSPLNGMLTSLSNNYNRRNKNIRLYELANIYIPKELPLKELPDERMQFTLGFYGDGDFFDMKGVVEEFLEKLGLDSKITYSPDCDRPYLHPGRKADIIYKNAKIGYLGEVHPLVCANYEIGKRAHVAVIDLPAILDNVNFNRKYEGVPKYPAVTRDISMMVPKEVMVGTIEEVIEKKGGAYLESFELFDIYEGSQIKSGYKSVAYSITFRAKDKTLEDNDITTAMNRIIKALEEKDIELRK